MLLPQGDWRTNAVATVETGGPRLLPQGDRRTNAAATVETGGAMQQVTYQEAGADHGWVLGEIGDLLNLHAQNLKFKCTDAKDQELHKSLSTEYQKQAITVNK